MFCACSTGCTGAFRRGRSDDHNNPNEVSKPHLKCLVLNNPLSVENGQRTEIAMNKIDDPLGFSDQWRVLGLITESQYQEHLCEFQKGVDNHPEHYRWRAFCDFIKRQNLMSNELLWQLYRIGEADPDYSMGGSIMAEIVRRPECPMDLLQEAEKKSGREYLQRIASARLSNAGY
jgi:hypothetical protein